MSRTRLKIYAAGKMSGLDLSEMNEWRVNLKNILDKLVELKDNYEINFINPVDFYNFDNKAHKTEKEIMLFDLAHVKSSDIIIVNLDGVNTSIGTCIELYEAYKREIPILAFGTDEIYEQIHPWIKECITRVESSIIGLCNYIFDFYMV